MPLPGTSPVTPFNMLDQESRDLAIRTLFGEAGSDPASQPGVAAVIKNRAAQSGKSIKDVVTAKNQFEPWNTETGRKRLMGLDPNSDIYKGLGNVIDNVWSGATADPTGGATLFYSPGSQAALGRNAPAWAKGDGLTLGAHKFYGGAFPEPKATNLAMAPVIPETGVNAGLQVSAKPPVAKMAPVPGLNNPFTIASGLGSLFGGAGSEPEAPTPSASLFSPGEGQDAILKSFQDAGMTPQQLAMIAQMMQQMV